MPYSCTICKTKWGRKVPMFSVPTNEMECMEWEDLIGQQLNRFSKVCAKHFKPTDIKKSVTGKRPRLYPNVLPSKLLHTPPTSTRSSTIITPAHYSKTRKASKIHETFGTMHCCVCALSIRTGQNVSDEHISDPPVPISEILSKYIGITSIDADSIVCKRCFQKLTRFYKTAQIARSLKEEILELFRQGQIEDNLVVNDIIMDQTTEKELDVKEDSKSSLVEFEERLEEVVIQYDVLEDIGTDYQEDEENKIKSDTVIVDENVSEEEIKDLEVSCDIDYVEIDETPADLDYIMQENMLEEPQHAIKTEDIKCEECDLSFKSERKHAAHMKKHHFSGYICEHCGKTLFTKTGFLQHLENHDPTNVLSCPVCEQHFKNKPSLKHHMAWHSGDKPHQCDICEKRFVHRVALYKHKMIHDNKTRRIECEVCGFKFRSKAHLQRHMMTHTGLKPYSCPVCGKCFSLAYNMRVHLKEHEQPGSTRQRRLRCKKCTRTFINRENYKEHCRQNDCHQTSEN